MTNFHTILIIVFVALLFVGVLIFSGVLPGFKGPDGVVVGNITMWGPVPAMAVAPMLASFNQAYQDQILVTYVAKDPARYEAELLEALASLAGPDLFFFPTDWSIRHADKIVPTPYESFPLREIQTEYLDQAGLFLRPNGLLAHPLYLDPLVLYYNKNLLASAGLVSPPTTWTKVKLDVPLLTKLDERRNILTSGVAMGQFSNLRSAKSLLEALFFQAGNPIVQFSAGSPRVVLEETFGFALPPAMRVVDFFNQFANPSSATYAWNRSLPEALTVFAAGNLAYYFGPASDLTKIRERNPHLEFDVAILPQKDEGPKITSAKMMGLAASRQSRNQAGAQFTARALAKANFAGALAKALYLPPARRDLLAQASVDPLMTVFNRSALVSRGWLDPHAAKSEAIFKDLIEATNTGRLTALDAVKEAAGELTLLYQ